MIRNYQRCWQKYLLGSVSALAVSLGCLPTLAQEATKKFNIDAQALDTALTEFSEQSDLVVMAPGGLVKDKHAPTVAGDFMPLDALDMLLRGSGLEASRDASGAIFIAARVEKVDRPVHRVVEDPEFEVEEIVVTGSNIVGVETASPIAVFDSAYIESAGFSTIGELIDSLPQNFGGGASLDTVSSPDPQSGLNRGAGTSVNLRGLGSGATLVLLNGRRLAQSGENGGFVDISLIPLSAIDRVEVLTDGASAIYGADAIGGVVNFITKSDFEGGETLLRYGTVTDGDLDEYRILQNFGTSWERGSIFASYEYYNRDALRVEDRNFNARFPDADLSPQAGRHSLFLSGELAITDHTTVLGDFLYSDRDIDIRDNFFTPFVRGAETEQLGGSLGVKAEFSDAWLVSLSGGYSQNSLDFTVDSGSTGALVGSGSFKSDLATIDAFVNGELFEIGGGRVRIATGLQYRNESLFFKDTITDTVEVDFGRDVFAAFGELLMPIVSSQNRMNGIERLEFSVAGRFEDYSDFGSTARPKIGLLWEVTEGLVLRATYSSSFKAPLLTSLSTATNGVLAVFASDIESMSPDGRSLILSRFGGNPDLEPETSQSFTAGLDYTPSVLPGLSVSLTYFGIEFEERIGRPFSNFNVPLTQPEVFAEFITRDPDIGVVDELLASPNLRDFTFTSFTPADVEAVLDQRVTNISATIVSGLEFDVSYVFDADAGSFSFGLRGDYLFDLEDRVSIQVDAIERLNTLFNPSDLRLRGNMSWSNGGLGLDTFINYVDSYTNDAADPDEPIDSFTTVDLRASYTTQGAKGLLNNVKVAVIVSNLFGEEPPFIDSSSAASATFGYDPTNASAVGRFVAFELSKKF